MLSLPPDDVRCIYVEGASCYGRNGHEDAAADAALLAKAAGKPGGNGWDPKGPPTLIDLRAAMDAAGNVTAWEGEFFIPQAGPGGISGTCGNLRITGSSPQSRASYLRPVEFQFLDQRAAHSLHHADAVRVGS